jgi:hypothetical protein
MKIALDTKVLACAEGTNGAAMRDKALELMERFLSEDLLDGLRGGASP